MHAALETLHRRYAEELDGFEGDVDGFAPAQRDLAGLLGEQAKERGKGGPAGRILVGVAALLLSPGSDSGGPAIAARHAAPTLERLSQTPGYWVDGSAESDHWRILRDPVSTPIEAVLGPDREKLDVRFDVSKFQSLDPALRARRVARLDCRRPCTGRGSATPWSCPVKPPKPGSRPNSPWPAPCPAPTPSTPPRWSAPSARRSKPPPAALDGLMLPFGSQVAVLDQPARRSPRLAARRTSTTRSRPSAAGCRCACSRFPAGKSPGNATCCPGAWKRCVRPCMTRVCFAPSRSPAPG
ncbi:MAG: hypothetical protein R3E96_14920 [Planctomycetota bacterium]